MIIWCTGASFAATFNVSTTQELRQALRDAATNGQEGIIILADVTYATTDDGQGTFTFFSNRNYDLTLQGSSAVKVILSGNSTHQVLNFNVINASTTIHLDNLSVMYGVSVTDGGGIFSEETLEIRYRRIKNNSSANYRGGYYAVLDAAVTNSTILSNTATGSGGRFCGTEATQQGI